MRWAQFPRFVTVTAAATLVAVAASAGCFETSNTCQRDFDCNGGSVCANTRECAAASDVHRVAVRWSVRGNPAGVDTCAGIANLELDIFDDVSGATSGYAPVPCQLGMFTFDKLPLAFNRVTLTAYAVSGGSESFTATIYEGQDIQFDLGLGSLPVDAGLAP